MDIHCIKFCNFQVKVSHDLHTDRQMQNNVPPFLKGEGGIIMLNNI